MITRRLALSDQLALLDAASNSRLGRMFATTRCFMRLEIDLVLSSWSVDSGHAQTFKSEQLDQISRLYNHAHVSAQSVDKLCLAYRIGVLSEDRDA